MAGTNGAHESIQLFPALDLATEAALEESIKLRGVIYPLVKDQHGRLLDGHHRLRIAEKLGVPYDVKVIEVGDDDDARAAATETNMARRHLGREEREHLVAALRERGHSFRAIAGALGVGRGTVERDAAAVPSGTPGEVVGRDGKRYPSTRPTTPAEVLERATWEEPALLDHLDELEDAVEEATEETEPEFQVEAAEAAVEIVCEHIEETADTEARWAAENERPAIVKPDLGNGISHPARFSDALLPIFAAILDELTDGRRVLDPFAGTGRVHELQAEGYETVGVEIEPEYVALHADTVQGDATALTFDAESFDAVVTSPTYGNRFADSYNSSDPHLRRSYHFDLGRELSPNNSGAMHWGPEYRKLHEAAWAEATRVLKPGGLLILNIKDHVRNFERQRVAGWHVQVLTRDLGLAFVQSQDVATPNLRQGSNADARFPEQIFVLRKDA